MKRIGIVLVVVLAGGQSGCGGDGSAGSGSGGAGGSIDTGTGGSPNASAMRPEDYIRNEGFGRLVVELDTVPGLSPRAGVVTEVVARVDEVLDKPDGIVIAVDETDLPSANVNGNGDGIWTFGELRQLAEEHANTPLDSGEIDIHTMWVDGIYENANVLGVAWGQRFVAIFAERIAQTCGVVGVGGLLCPLAESTIWTHEIGHVIGLVDNGTPMINDHRDPEHPGHDVSDESVMYWAYEGVGVMDVLQARILGNDAEVIPWGTECLNDLAAVRGN